MARDVSRLNFAPAARPTGELIGFAPLVDVVLLLIAFYLFVADFMKRYDDPDVHVPVVTADVTAEQRPAVLVVNVRPDGSIEVNNQAVALTELAAFLASEHRRADTPGGAATDVVVRIDRRLAYERLDEVLSLCRAAGWERVTLRAVDRE